MRQKERDDLRMSWSDLDTQTARRRENDWQLWRSTRYVFRLQRHNPTPCVRINQKCYTDHTCSNANVASLQKAMKTVTRKATSSGRGSHIILGEEKSDKPVLNDFLIRKMVPRERNQHATGDVYVQEQHMQTSWEDDFFVLLHAPAANPSCNGDKCP